MTLNDPEDGVSIWVGGKVSNARREPMFSKLAIPFLPNNPPRWPEVTTAVKALVELYAAHAKPFFRMAGIPFTRDHIDDFTHAGATYKCSVQLRRSPAWGSGS